MRIHRTLWPLAAIACLLLGVTFGFAQQSQQPTPYWYVTQYQVDFRHTGSEWNVLRIRKFPTWAAMKVFPDSTQRAANNRAFQSIFHASPHRDGIYVEVGA
jgi:hypothetical protein